VALELLERGHTITWICPFNDKELQGIPNITTIPMDNDMDSIVNSTAVFDGEVFMNFQAFVNYSMEVTSVPSGKI